MIMNFYKILIVILLLSTAKLYAQKPNIIIIMADDMGYSDIGSFGSEIATPNLDKLAAGGLTMTQFYNASRCCPSRASLLTGLYPHQAGMGDMVDAKPAPGYQGYLNKNSVTIAEVLRSNGYRTYMSGKWHVGQKYENWPLQGGFDEYYGLIDGASSYFNPTTPYRPNQKLKLVKDNTLISSEENWYATDAYTNEAINYITANTEKDKKPFFLYLAYTSPHWPLNALQEDIRKYRGNYKKTGWDELRKQRLKKMVSLGILPKETRLSPRDAAIPAWDEISDEEKDKWDAEMSVYAAMVDRMDQNIGKVLLALEKSGQRDNTIIFFLSDNGASHEEISGGFLPEILQASKKPSYDHTSFTAYGRAGANVSNTPFSSYKHWQQEGGISTPLIVSYPGLISNGFINHQPAHIIDLMPTCLELAQATYPTQFEGNNITATPGISLLPLIKNQQWKGHSEIYFEHEGNKAVRQGKWKLVATFPEQKWKLYDMESDRTEQFDLSASHKKQVAIMDKLYVQWAEKSGVVPFEQFKKPGSN
ncbi:arylsulfatase [Pedobacter aquatilis]|uniref:arylsulfatase n=1 Tax=Pedobacter aquatilis TaxID=351343 RepID=UPI00292D2CE7|nr:arylsulfatase [Pedobacter aquatilis]